MRTILLMVLLFAESSTEPKDCLTDDDCTLNGTRCLSNICSPNVTIFSTLDPIESTKPSKSGGKVNNEAGSNFWGCLADWKCRAPYIPIPIVVFGSILIFVSVVYACFWSRCNTYADPEQPQTLTGLRA